MRTIIKHANRRLYDASERRAITLLEISELVVAGETISVLEKVTGEDITVVTLLQSVLERLRRGAPGGIDVGEVDGLVAAMRTAMAAVAGETYDPEIEAGSGTVARTVGGAA